LEWQKILKEDRDRVIRMDREVAGLVAERAVVVRGGGFSSAGSKSVLFVVTQR
jgi:hypothetical protein